MLGPSPDGPATDITKRRFRMRKMKLFSVFALLALLLSAGMGSAAAQQPPSDAQRLESLARAPKTVSGQSKPDRGIIRSCGLLL
jgi:hypothetical protein